MSSNASSPRPTPPSPAEALESISRLFANAWQAGEAPAIREFAQLIPDSLAIEDRRHALFTLVMIDLEQRWSSKGLSETSRAAASTHGPRTEAPAASTLAARPLVEDYLALFPELGPLESIPAELAELERSLRASQECSPTIDFNRTAHHDGQTVKLAAKNLPPDGSAPTHSFPALIGRYKISSVLGAGSFGTVYLGYDGDLERKVAIKVPIGFEAVGGAAENFLAEARHAAKLRHPGIVAVYDVGVEPSGLPFIVMEYVDGVTLENLMRRQRLGREEAIDVMIRIGEAVHFAHQKGLVHRDLKPGNILMEQERAPRVVDFGLAVVEEEQMEQAGRVAGTPYYMSPELSRGETHRLDGRSDLWSLGVIFYELLTGVRPFGRVSTSRLHDEIQHRDPKPPRQFDDTIAKPLEFACLKCLSKRVSDRYATVADFVQDLRDAARSPTGSHDSVARRLADQPSPDARTGVIPKGLRSFGAMDADFFLTLLPGPRDRNGLPEPIRFWKNCLENRRPESASPLCVLYGPSGCGKSSLMKAGVLPRLSAEVTPVFIEATQIDTEQRLSRALAHTQLQCDDNDDLPRTICRIRQKLEAKGGPKLLIVVDQFEQWLHQGKTGHDSELVRGLRQCDGVNVQCLLLVRDDFWMGVTRVAHEVEMRLIDGENSAPVDLFDRNHAKKVLTMFGQAYSQLPEVEEDLSDAHHKFVEAAVASIEDKGYVSPVLLSLFADMLKGRPWHPDTLRTLGGAQGVAEAFLEETFCSRSSPLGRRRHEASARRVLAAMLPVDQAEIRGPMIPVESMRIAAGYDSGSDDFASLLQILDSELRLISPCDPEGATSSNPTHAGHAGQYFQLTHDVLVPALRRWLTRRLRETRRGRAQLILEERTEQWSAARDKRYLPTAVEWGKILLFSRKSNWTEPQKSTMRHATRRHLLRAAAYLSAAALLTTAYLYSRPSQLEVFANVKSGHARRAAALGLLDLNQPEQIAQVCETLADDPDAQLVIDGLRAISANGAGGPENRAKSAIEAADVRSLCKRLINSSHDLDDGQRSPEHARWEKVQLEALDTYGEFATPKQFWELAIDVQGRPVADRVVRAVVDKARATDWQTLSPAESQSLQAMLVDRLPRQSNQELAAAGITLLRQLRGLTGERPISPTPDFFRWLVRSAVMQEGSAVCAAAVSYLDSLTPVELTRTVVATAQEDNDIAVAAELWLAPYAKLAAPQRIDELGDWSERRFLQNARPTDDPSGEISLSSTAIYHVQAVAMLSQYSTKRREAVYRRAYSLLQDWQALDAIDAFEPIARAMELLHTQGESSQRDESIRESLTAAIAQSESPFTRAAAVRTLGSLDGSNETTIKLIAKIAADDGEPFIVREACLRSLTSLADYDDFAEPAAQALRQLFLDLSRGDPSQRIRSMAIVSFGRVADLTGIEQLKPLLIDQGLNPAASTALWSILQRHPDQAGDGIAAVAEFLALEYPKHEAKLPFPATMMLAAIAVSYTDEASTLAFQNIVKRLGELAESEPNEAVRAFCRDAQDKLEVVLQGNKAHAPPETSGEPARSKTSPAK